MANKKESKKATKKTEKKKEEIIVSDEPVVIVEEPFVLKEREAKIIPMKDIKNVYIGGKYYHFKKNTEQKVPVDVERVLRERDLIK